MLAVNTDIRVVELLGKLGVRNLENLRSCSIHFEVGQLVTVKTESYLDLPESSLTEMKQYRLELIE